MSGEDAPPGSPPEQLHRYDNPLWLQTQLGISLFLGLSSFFIFCFCRTRYRVTFAPRTLLKGFSPHEAHQRDSFFGWILPTLRTSEYAILQIVGLDAAVLLSFLKLGFQFFAICTVLACAVIMPINWKENGTIEGVPPAQTNNNGTSSDGDGDQDFVSMLLFKDGKHRKIAEASTLYLSSHLLFTYLFSLIALYMLIRTYRRFVHSRQLFSLDYAHSIPARTVIVTRVPPHLRSERQLAEYFQSIGPCLAVESVNVVRQSGVLGDLLAIRTEKLRQLEDCWTRYVGNPVKPIYNYDREKEVDKIMESDSTSSSPTQNGGAAYPRIEPYGKLIETDDTTPNDNPTSNTSSDADAELAIPKPSKIFIIPGKKRPTVRASIFGKKVDALEYYAKEFREADEAVKARRRGRFRPTEIAFVTFESIIGAQIASQAVHFPQASAMYTALAPEPRDVHWGNVGMPQISYTARQCVVFVIMIILLIFWSSPVFFLAGLLSYETIKRYSPWLAKLIDRFPIIQALVQNSLPSLALISFNALLPYLLEALCIFQGLKAKSWIEYALLKKYYIFLLVTVFFIMLSASTTQLARDLADQPMKLPEKLATSLPGARKFYVSYVMLQALGFMPLQLIQLGTIIPNFFYRAFLTRTPRDHAELHNPPVLNLGVVYPQALLIFTIGLTYSVIMPLILVFTTLYFGITYTVYKYKLLNVFYRPYESRGQAWSITASRISFGIFIFQIFMTGLFTLRDAPALSLAMAPLIIGTTFASYKIHSTFKPLGHFVNLSQAAEIQREGTAPDVQKLKKGHPVTPSQTNLNRSRYKHKDDDLYVVGKDDKTDYSQPPMSDVFYGVLHTGRRRYGHPALSGSLPSPWLPAEAVKDYQKPSGISSTEAITLNLRRKWSNIKKGAKNLTSPNNERRRESTPGLDDSTRAWREDVDQAENNRDGLLSNPFESGTPSDDEQADEDDAAIKYPTFYTKRRKSRFTNNEGHDSSGDD